MKYKKIAVAATFVGALIGAGFASGREISLYFGHTSVFTPLIAGVFLAFFCYLFLEAGRITGGKPALLWKKGDKPAEAVIRLCNAVTFCAMIAGSEEVVFSLFGFHGGGIITGILALAVVALGAEKLKFSNFLIVPVIVVLIGVLFIGEHSSPAFEKLSVVPAFTYCTMNIIGGGYLVSGFSADFTKKDCAGTALLCGVILTALLLAVFFTVQNYLDEAMPLIAAAEKQGLAKVGNAVMYLAIFTTLTGSLSIAGKNSLIASGLLTALSFCVSLLGFRKIVDRCYPIIGIAGGAISLVYLFLYLRKRKKTDLRGGYGKYARKIRKTDAVSGKFR